MRAMPHSCFVSENRRHPGDVVRNNTPHLVGNAVDLDVRPPVSLLRSCARKAHVAEGGSIGLDALPAGSLLLTHHPSSHEMYHAKYSASRDSRPGTPEAARRGPSPRAARSYSRPGYRCGTRAPRWGLRD